ncbi:MAG: hypothetical protein HOA08_09520 [Rhodospirillaceae bacterium]|jgi:hypothetical protein|nr:hypothetical protein [Rhodospirillaceae bacterium]MBT3782267.1 hypothetical protein [Rhodospirillaceae bacterium]MBT3977404.1 hypothetical protein [Rhodospirillaceae bacterium]MBT4167833.1 hypothetical protein [Rhodospirillaceae bacterium]MBT4561718.1 hypothetical protein [Rhodospirillaceae bacterium]
MTLLAEDWLNKAENRSLKPVYVATLLILLLEASYFVVWGLLLYPDGSLFGKLVWVLTCSIGMGAVIGVATQILVSKSAGARTGIMIAATVMAVVGIFCTLVCSRIDVHFNYFGGADNARLFVLSGIVPAIFGGLIYGRLLYGRPRLKPVA